MHPSGRPVSRGADSLLPEWIESPLGLEPDEYEQIATQAVTSFPPGSAAGPTGTGTGTRTCHLKDCLRRSGACTVLRCGLGLFVEAAANGKLPRAMREWLCASNLIAINKKDGACSAGHSCAPLTLRHSFRACSPANVGLAYLTNVRWWGGGSPGNGQCITHCGLHPPTSRREKGFQHCVADSHAAK